MWTMETHHRHIAFVQPVQVTHCSSHVHLKVEITGVAYVVGHAQLEPS